MLVLSRKTGEEIIVGDNQVRIRVIEIRGDKVRIGIEADEGISIHRQEVFQRIKQQDKEAEERKATRAATAED